MLTIHEVWYGKSIGATIARILLLPFSWLYSLGWKIYVLSYKLGINKPYRASCKVICVGNFSAGGTGKTPTVIFVANCLREMGLPFVIGCSGYGAQRSAGATLAPTGPILAAEWGDEPAEIRDILRDVPIIVGRARVTAAQICERECPGSILLMDDGFQHLPLEKDLSIILDPETSNSFTFPAGPYREPRSEGEKRADLVVPSPVFKHRFSDLIFMDSEGSSIPPPKLAHVLTAIGRPDLFRLSLEAAGISIVNFHSMPDHHKLENTDLLTAIKQGTPWIVTRKDWVKVRSSGNSKGVDFIIAERSARIEPEADFSNWLKMRLG